MRATILPSRACGTIPAPPSKSHAHRALITAALAPGGSVIRGLDPSQDLLATMDCLRALGARIDYDGDTAFVTGMDLTAVPDGAVLPCRASGSTLRFLIPAALLSDKYISFTGTDTLMSRPLSVYEKLCRDRGLSFLLSDRSLTVRGPLTAGEYTVPGDVSSQFISGLLFALPLLSGDSVIRILSPIESRPYIRMTLAALRDSGVVIHPADGLLSVPGGQRFAAHDTSVEGDWSGAAFFLALNRLGGSVTVTGLRADSLQGDRVCESLFQLLASGSPVVDLSDCPDLGPVCMALAAALRGAVFTGVRRLRLKESDRCAAMIAELAKFGVAAESAEDTLTVRPGSLRRPTEPLDGRNDHRVVMALSVLATVTGAVIDGAEAVDKSMPDFFDRLQNLGIEVELA